MDEKAFKKAEGSCIISEEVIATIACTAAVEVPGVASWVSARIFAVSLPAA